MDDVVEASGLGKGTVYWHFKSKENLLAAVMRRFLSLELRRLERAAPRDGPVAERLLAFFRRIAQELKGVGALMPVSLEFYAIALRREWARALLRDYYAEFRRALLGLLQAGVDRGEFRPVPLEDCAVVLCALMEGLILTWVVDSRTVRIDDHTEAALRLVLDGLRCRPTG